MKKILKRSFIVLISLIFIILLYLTISKIEYIQYKSKNLEIAQSTLLEYDIVSEFDLNQENVTKEIYIVSLMRVLGLNDAGAKNIGNMDFEVGITSRLGEDMAEAKKEFGYWYAAVNVCGLDVDENDGGLYPQKLITNSMAIDSIYRMFYNRETYKLRSIKDKIVFLSYDKELKKDDFIIWMYKILQTKRLRYFKQTKEFDSIYNRYIYKFWTLYLDPERECTYLEMIIKQKAQGDSSVVY